MGFLSARQQVSVSQMAHIASFVEEFIGRTGKIFSGATAKVLLSESTSQSENENDETAGFRSIPSFLGRRRIAKASMEEELF